MTTDAGQLHEAGYTRRQIWAKWVLDDFKVLHWQLVDDERRPLEDDPKVDASFYMSPVEWREVAAAARRIADLSVLIAQMREDGRDE